MACDEVQPDKKTLITISITLTKTIPLIYVNFKNMITLTTRSTK